MGTTGNKQHVLALLGRREKSDRNHINGIVRFAEAHEEWDLRILNTDSDDLRRECRDALVGWRVDGMIFSSPKACRIALDAIGSGKRPRLVEIDFPSEGITPDIRVCADNRLYARLAAELFLKRGIRHLAYFGQITKREASHSICRRDAFLTEANKAGAVYSQFESIGHCGDWAAWSARLTKWIQSLPKPCGVFMFADEPAFDFYAACRHANVSIPDQVSVIGVDNDLDICETITPTLTSINPDFEEAGYIAATSLHSALGEPRRSPVRLIHYGCTGIVERSSTCDLSGFGRIVSKAQEIIRTTTCRGLTVAELSRMTNVSPRMLEISFKKVLMRSPGAEIRRTRIDLAMKLLKTTDSPIGVVAEQSGYRTLTSAQIAFKNETGLSMRAWRLAHRHV